MRNYELFIAIISFNWREELNIFTGGNVISLKIQVDDAESGNYLCLRCSTIICRFIEEEFEITAEQDFELISIFLFS